jgi:mannose-1-phosphate guanylyltransferase
MGGQSLLQAAVERARRVAGNDDKVWLVCGKEHARSMRAHTGLPASRVLVEPSRRNTAMAVAWAALRIQAEAPDAVMVMLSADHHIPDVGRFARAIGRAARAADQAGVLVTLGVEPTRPDTGYGYIKTGRAMGSAHPGLHVVSRFLEKPDAARAKRFVKNGGYLWNAGIFVWSVSTLLEEIEACAPDLHSALAPLRRRPRGRNRSEVEAAYRKAPSLAIDVAVMEASERVWTIPVDFAWSDLGTWSSLAMELGVGQEGRRSSRTGKRRAKLEAGPSGRSVHLEGGNRIVDGEVILEDAHANLIWGADRPIALLGVDDLAVIDTGDVILITKLERSPDVRKLVATLKEAGRDELT